MTRPKRAQLNAHFAEMNRMLKGASTRYAEGDLYEAGGNAEKAEDAYALAIAHLRELARVAKSAADNMSTVRADG